MIAEIEQQQDLAFFNRLQEFASKLDEAPAIKKMQTAAWERFLTIGLPVKSNDVYRYMPLKKLYEKEIVKAESSSLDANQIDSYILPECQNSVLVFINGCFSLNLSRTSDIGDRVVISTVDDAMLTFSSFISSQWTKSLKEEQDPFVALSLALQRDALFLYIPPKTIIKKQVQLLYITDVCQSESLVLPRAQIFVGGSSEIALVSTQAVVSGEKFISNGSLDISIEENAHVQYTQNSCGITKDIWLFDALRASLKRNSSLKTFMATQGSVSIRYDYRVALNGENGNVELNGVSMVKEATASHVHVFVDHQAPNCRSLQLFKGVLNDFGHTAFEGKIMVRQAAQKTEAFQLNNNLLLSDRSHADSKPNLEIFADDVKASHGSTIGQLDSEQIYYMKTRGFSESMAKNLLVKGFCAEVIDKMTIPSVQESVRKRAAKFLL